MLRRLLCLIAFAGLFLCTRPANAALTQTWYGLSNASLDSFGNYSASYSVGDETKVLCAVQGITGFIDNTRTSFLLYFSGYTWTLFLSEDTKSRYYQIQIGCVPWSMFHGNTPTLTGLSNPVSLLSTGNPATISLWPDSTAFCDLAGQAGWVGSGNDSIGSWIQESAGTWYESASAYAPISDELTEGWCFSFTRIPSLYGPATIPMGPYLQSQLCNINDGVGDDICVDILGSHGTGAGNTDHSFCAITSITGGWDEASNAGGVLKIYQYGSNGGQKLYSENLGRGSPPYNALRWNMGSAECIDFYVPYP